jgi:hypothetical protein
MLATSPFELLAEELGAVAGRIEREAGYKIAALIADVQRRFAEFELKIERQERMINGLLAERITQWDNLINEKLSSLRSGTDGLPGKDGVDGASGKDGVDGSPGKDGTDGLPGKDGEPGPAGERGEQGERGEAGPMGLKGDTGDRGEKGVGVAGPQGERGEIGPRGEKGDPGLVGQQGLQGASGKLPKVKLWKQGAVHYDSDVVVHDGALYQALQDTAKTPGSDEWICLARGGKDGADGRSLTIKDTYNPEEKYRELDVVTLDHKWFVAKHDDPGACPGPGWKAGPGIGKTGRPGEAGPIGPKGDPGLSAPSVAEIVDWEINNKTYTVAPVMSDGSLGPMLSLRDLFAQFQAEAG